MLFEKVEKEVPQFKLLDEKNKFVYLMSHEGNIIKDVAKYITLVMNTRKQESALM